MAGLRSNDVYDSNYVPPSANAPDILPSQKLQGVGTGQRVQSEFSKGVETASRGLRGDVARAAELTARAAGAQDVEQAASEVAMQEYEAASAVPAGKVESIFDVGSVQDFTDWASYGLGQLVPFALSMVSTGMAGALVGGATRVASLARAGGMAGGYLGSAVPQAGSAYNEMKASGVQNPGAAALEGGINALFDIAPASHILNILGTPGKGVLRGIGRGITEQAPYEAATEAAQTGISDIFRREFIPGYENQNLSKDLIEAAALGGLGGGVIGGVSGGARGVVDRVTQPLPSITAKDQAASANEYDPTYEDFAASEEDSTYEYEGIPDQMGYDQADIPSYDRLEGQLDIPTLDTMPLTVEAKKELGMEGEKLTDNIGNQLEVLNRPFIQPEADIQGIRDSIVKLGKDLELNKAYLIEDQGKIEGMDIPESFAKMLVPEDSGYIVGQALRNRLATAYKNLQDYKVPEKDLPFQRESMYDRVWREAWTAFPEDKEARQDYVDSKAEELFTQKVNKFDEGDAELIKLLRISNKNVTPEQKARIAELRKQSNDSKKLFWKYDQDNPAEFLRLYESIKAPPPNELRDALTTGKLDPDTEAEYKKLLSKLPDQSKLYSLQGRELGRGERGLQIAFKADPNYEIPMYGSTGKPAQFKSGDQVINLLNLTTEARKQRKENEKLFPYGDKPTEEYGMENELQRLGYDVLTGLSMLAEQGLIDLPKGVKSQNPVVTQNQLYAILKKTGAETVVDPKGRTIAEALQAVAQPVEVEGKTAARNRASKMEFSEFPEPAMGEATQYGELETELQKDRYRDTNARARIEARLEEAAKAMNEVDTTDKFAVGKAEAALEAAQYEADKGKALAIFYSTKRKSMGAEKKLNEARSEYKAYQAEFKARKEGKGKSDLSDAELTRRLTNTLARGKSLAAELEKYQKDIQKAAKKAMQYMTDSTQAVETEEQARPITTGFTPIESLPSVREKREGRVPAQQKKPVPKQVRNKGVNLEAKQAETNKQAMKDLQKGSAKGPKRKPDINDWRASMNVAPSERGMTYAEVTTLNNEFAQKQFDMAMKALNAPESVTYMDAKQAIQYLRKHRAEWITRLMEGTLNGFKVSLPGGKIGIYVHPKLDKQHASEVLAHEIGHAVFAYHIQNADDATVRAIYRDYVKWRDSMGREDVTLKEVLYSKKPPRSALIAMGNNPDTTLLEELSESSIDYQLDYEEWFADNVSRWFTTERKPQTIVEKFFEKVANAIKRLVGLAPDKSVDTLMEQIMGGKREWNIQKEVDKVLKESASLNFTASDREKLKNLGIRKDSDWDWVTHPASLANIAVLDSIDPNGGVFHAAFWNYMGKLKPHVANILKRAAMNDSNQRQMRSTFKHDNMALKQLGDPDRAAAYMYQLWRAGLIKVGDRTDTHFHRIAKSFRDTLGVVSDSKNAVEIFKQIEDNLMPMTEEGQRAAVQRVLPGSAAGAVVRTFGPAWEAAAKPMGVLFRTVDERVRATDNPYLIELANKLHNKPGDMNSDYNIWIMKTQYKGRFDNIIRNIFEGKDAEFGQEALDYLYGVKDLKKAPPGTRRVVERVRKLMREILKYAEEAGVEIKDIGPEYFPWMFDKEVLAENSAELEKVLRQEKYKKKRIDLAAYINKRDGDWWAEQRMKEANDEIRELNYRNRDVPEYLKELGSYKTYEEAFETYARTSQWTLFKYNIDPPGFLQDSDTIVDYMMRNAMQVMEDEVEITEEKRIPVMRFKNPRLFKFVEPAEIRPFLTSDLGLVTGMYISQAVKHAEYVRRFGSDGGVIRDLLDEAKRAGATPQQLKLARNYVKASVGTYGRHTAEWLNKWTGLAMPENQWSPINEGLNKVMGAGIVFQNMMYLGLATLTSLADPMGIAVRSSSLTSVTRGLKAYIKRNKNNLQDLGEMLGIIEHEAISDALGWKYDGMHLTGNLRKFNDGFFKLIGLTGWTRMTRLMGLAAAESFIVKHATKPGKHSERYLQELGLTAANVKQRKDGTLRVLSNEERSKASKEEKARDDKVRHALVQFTDEAILRPNPSMRTLWGSDPHYQLLQYLKSFMYTFHERILKRVGHEAMEQNYAAFVWLLSYIPVMIAADMVREAIQYGPDGDPRKDSWEFWDYIQHGAIRAGLLGYAQQGVELHSDMKMGGYGLGGFAATFDTMAQLSDLPTLEGEEFIQVAPGQTIYREWLK